MAARSGAMCAWPAAGTQVKSDVPVVSMVVRTFLAQGRAPPLAQSAHKNIAGGTLQQNTRRRSELQTTTEHVSAAVPCTKRERLLA